MEKEIITDNTKLIKKILAKAMKVKKNREVLIRLSSK